MLVQVFAKSIHMFVLGVISTALGFSVVAYVLIRKVMAAAESPSHPFFFALLIGALLGGLPLVWYWHTKELPSPAMLGILFLSALSVFLVSVYLYRTSFYVTTRADMLIWAESGYVNNIIKLRTGTPLYGLPDENNTAPYTPGSEVLTYLIASALGYGVSIPFYRGIQLAYVLLACMLATASCVHLARMVLPNHRFQSAGLWVAFWFPALILIGTNRTTSPFAHALHNDALRLLVASLAIWLMVRHTSTGDHRWLLPMAALPAVGFLIKQSLAAWAGIYVIYLISHNPAAIRRTMVFMTSTFLLLASAVGMCFLLWGKLFFYWTFEMLRGYTISPLRVVNNALLIWVFIALGLFGGWVLLRGNRFRRLLPVWLAWLLLMSTQLYTSGMAWMLHHMASASLFAGIWFLVALARVWPGVDKDELAAPGRAQPGLQVGLAAALVCALFGGMGFFRLPVKPVSADLDRYIEQIENEFQELPADRVLLDSGSWMYLKENAVVKDRSAPIVNQATIGWGDVSQMIRRIREKHYAKILVRHLHSDNFLYEWAPGAPAPQHGIRTALLENYHEARRIRPVEGTEWWWKYLTGEMFVLEPNSVLAPAHE